MFFELSGKELKELKGYIKNYKNEFRDKLNVPGELKFGCEVEFNTDKDIFYYKKALDHNYKLMFDGSGDDIIEMITPILYNTKNDWEKFENNISKIKYACIKSNVGGHIHYDASIVKDKNIVNMLKLWHVFEDIIYDFSAGEFEKLRPSAETYAEKLFNIRKYIDKYENGMKTINTFDNIRKYNGLNISNHIFSYLSSYSIKDTYEVRVPNGSLDITIWQNNVEFFARFFKYANDEKNQKIIDNLYKFGKLPNNYIDQLFLADLIYEDEESKIRFLNQFELKNKFADGSCEKSIYL